MTISRSTIRLKLNPGAGGTRALLKQYGDKLVCVRYRYDQKQAVRYKTAEILVDQTPWLPAKSRKIVGVVVHWSEKDLQRTVKNAGGTWSKSRKLWKMPYKKACELGLKERIRRI